MESWKRFPATTALALNTITNPIRARMIVTASRLPSTDARLCGRSPADDHGSVSVPASMILCAIVE